MKNKIYSVIVIFLMLAFNQLALAQSDSALAPDFNLHGKQANVKLSDYHGKLVYLDFWASWCGPCKQSFPWMNAMQAKYHGQDFEVIAINLDNNSEDAQKFLANNPAIFTVAFDNEGQTPRLYGVKGMPTSYLISRDGKIIMQHLGFNNAEREKLEQKIQSSLDEKK